MYREVNEARSLYVLWAHGSIFILRVHLSLCDSESLVVDVVKDLDIESEFQVVRIDSWT